MHCNDLRRWRQMLEVKPARTSESCSISWNVAGVLYTAYKCLISRDRVDNNLFIT